MSFEQESESPGAAESKLIEPFYATAEQIEALRLEIETVGPEKWRDLQALQRKACEMFIGAFGDALSDNQRAYLRSNNVIIADPDILSELSDHFDSNIEQTSHQTLLEGKQFVGYRIGTSHHGGEVGDDDDRDILGGDPALHLWAGRIPVVPLLRDFQDEPLHADLLVSERECERTAEAAGRSFFAVMPAFVATKLWAGAALHEKLHGIQRYDLPFPLLEIIAHFYSNEALSRAGLGSLEQPAFDRAHQWWGSLVQEVGSDLHAFVFGNAPEPRASEIRNILMTRMTLKTLGELFSGKGGPYDSVEWIAAE